MSDNWMRRHRYRSMKCWNVLTILCFALSTGEKIDYCSAGENVQWWQWTSSNLPRVLLNKFKSYHIPRSRPFHRLIGAVTTPPLFFRGFTCLIHRDSRLQCGFGVLRCWRYDVSGLTSPVLSLRETGWGRKVAWISPSFAPDLYGTSHAPELPSIEKIGSVAAH